MSLVYNWADEGTYFPTESTGELRGRIGADDADTILLYAGNHGFAQGLSAWIEAMGLVRDLPGIRLVLVGDGPAKAQLRELAWASSARDKIHLVKTRSLEISSTAGQPTLQRRSSRSPTTHSSRLPCPERRKST